MMYVVFCLGVAIGAYISKVFEEAPIQGWDDPV